MSEASENKRLTEAEESYARIKETIKPFLPRPKKTDGMRPEAWRSGKTSPIKWGESRQTESYVSSRRRSSA